MICIKSINRIYLYSTDRNEFSSRAPRKQHIMSYQLDGSYDHYINGKNGRLLSVCANTLFFINGKDSYYVKKQLTGTSVCVAFESELDIPTQTVDCAKLPHIKNLFIKIQNFKNLSYESNEYFAASILYELFGILFKNGKNCYLSNSNRTLVLNAENYIASHCCDSDFKIDNIPILKNISQKYFRTLFKTKFGTTPLQYAIEIKLLKSAKLLRETNLSITETAETCGFSDIYYFSRLFKKKYGISPRAFSKSNKI